MDPEFTAEQTELRRAVRELAADRASSAQVRAAIEGADGYDVALWKLIGEELGLPGLAVPETSGGAGGSFVELAIAFEEAGRALLPVPLLPSGVAATVLSLCAPADTDDVVAALASGAAIGTVALGTVDLAGDRVSGVLHHVIDGGDADVVVVAAPDGLWLTRTDRDGVHREPTATLDPTRRQAVVRLDGAVAQRVGDGEASRRAVDLLRVALSVEAIGVARWSLETTVDYLKTRVQFDRVIGSFQALQHRAADLAVRLESAAATAYFAAWVAANRPEELAVTAPLALSVCGAAAYDIAAETIQLHGGIGFTWEHDAHLYFKRATGTRLILGDSHEQRRLVAERAGLRG